MSRSRDIEDTRRGDEEGSLAQGEQALALPKAGDNVRQIGMGFLMVADVLDKKPPLQLLFEEGWEQFRALFQAPGALVAVSGSRAGASGAQDPAKSPAGSRAKLSGEEPDTEGAGADALESAAGDGGSRSSPPLDRVSGLEDGARGRRGTRRWNVMGNEAEAWSGQEGTPRASKEDEAASRAGRGICKGVGARSRPADPRANVESAKRDQRRCFPPMPAAFGIPPAPPQRRAAAAARVRLSVLSYRGRSTSTNPATASSELACCSGKKSKATGEDLLGRLDARVFRFVEAGACRGEGCKVRDRDHCHRGPGCDCTKRPAFGKRVLVKFEDGTYYPGTINTYGDSAKDMRHSKGRWGVLFDDCSRTRFAEGDPDVMISNQPRPTKVSKELFDYIHRHENGPKLLEGAKVFPVTRNIAKAVDVAGKRGKQSPAGRKGGGSTKHKRHKSSADIEPREKVNIRDDVGGSSGKLKRATAGERWGVASPDAIEVTAAEASVTPRAKLKRKHHSVATEDEVADIELREQEAGERPPRQEDESGGVARGEDDHGRGNQASEAGSAKGNSRGEKKRAGGSISRRNRGGTAKKHGVNVLSEVVRTGNIGKDDHRTAANADAKTRNTGDGRPIDGPSRVSRNMSSRVSKQRGEEGSDGDGGGGGIEESDEHSGERGREGFNGGAGKHKKPKKSRTGKQRSRVDLSSGGNGDGGGGRAEESNALCPLRTHRYERGSGTVVLSAPDIPGRSATNLAEGSDHIEEGNDNNYVVETFWVSPVSSRVDTASPPPDVGQEQSLPPPPHLFPAHRQQQQQQQQSLQGIPVSEDEESTDKEEETVRAVRGRLGQGATNPASQKSRDSGAASYGASGEANVVPVLKAPSSRATPDSTTESVAAAVLRKLKEFEATRAGTWGDAHPVSGM
eukprot:g3510.t1